MTDGRERDYAPRSATEREAEAVVFTALRDRGFDPAPPIVPQRSLNVVLSFAELGIVVKATKLAPDMLEDEALVLHHLRDAPVSRLAFGGTTTDALEHRDGWTLLFLERLESTGEPTAAEAMSSLYVLHQRSAELNGVPALQKVLERRHWKHSMQGGLDLLPQYQDRAIAQELTAYAERWVLPLMAREFDDTVVHGDCFEDNRILTADGVKWIDFGNFCRAPIEYDVGLLNDYRHYPGPYDPELRLAMWRAQAVGMTLWNYWLGEQDWEHAGPRALQNLEQVRAVDARGRGLDLM